MQTAISPVYKGCMLASHVGLWKPPHKVWGMRYLLSSSLTRCKSHSTILWKEILVTNSLFNHPNHPNPITLDNIWWMWVVKQVVMDFLWLFALKTGTSLCRPHFHLVEYIICGPLGWDLLHISHVLMLLTVLAQHTQYSLWTQANRLALYRLRMYMLGGIARDLHAAILSCPWHSQVWPNSWKWDVWL